MASYPALLTIDELKIVIKHQERQFMSEIVCFRDGKESNRKVKDLGCTHS